MIDNLEKQFDQKISTLTESEQKVFKTIKKWTFGLYTTIKPFVIAIAMFWIFNKVKLAVGMQEAMYIVMIMILIFLRMILAKLN